jgi:hypothetical protein
VEKMIDLKNKVPDAGGGVVSFLRAEWWDPSSRFVLVRYSRKGHEEELGLRLDLDKRVFLDHLSDDPHLDADVQSRVETIWKIVAQERSEVLTGGSGPTIIIGG